MDGCPCTEFIFCCAITGQEATQWDGWNHDRCSHHCNHIAVSKRDKQVINLFWPNKMYEKAQSTGNLLKAQGGEGCDLMKVSLAKVLMELLVELPSVIQPPTKSHWIVHHSLSKHP